MIRVGTRGSALALAQAGQVAAALTSIFPELETQLVPIKTSGDRGQTASDKSRFVTEIEQALLRAEVDLAVHSAKDLPAEKADGLQVVSVPRRVDARDVWVGTASSLDQVQLGATVGTASLRRRSQLKSLRPDLEVTPLRGNVDSRLSALERGEFEGAVLAAAGLVRLGRQDQVSFYFETPEFLPAPGQGALALQIRAGDTDTGQIAAALNDSSSQICFSAERTLVEQLNASCHTPLGAHAWLADGELSLAAFAGLPDGSKWLRDQVSGDPAGPARLGQDLAARMRAAGAEEILAEAATQAEHEGSQR